MARTARLGSSTGIFHVMIRGVNRQPIFERDGDRERFLGIVQAVKKLSGCQLYSYCLMENHVHLLLREGDEPLAVIMKRINVRYATWFNSVYGRVGHLLQDRFRSCPVEDEAYLITVLRYIWLNPVRAGFCASAADYPWGSRRWAGLANDLLDESSLLEFLPVDRLAELDQMPDDPDSIRLPDPPRPRLRRDWRAELASTLGALGLGATVADFQRLPIGRQRLVIQTLCARGAKRTELAKLTGLSKTQVHWRAVTASATADQPGPRDLVPALSGPRG
ncbi:MAG: transposase [Bifidobacteriaceae bacterium]|jgi:REP element-mobilizing transposase RayT|nr:transposase [Bifidobacteriaceae bacterium]